jgi:hypothetical protein
MKRVIQIFHLFPSESNSGMIVSDWNDLRYPERFLEQNDRLFPIRGGIMQ